MNFFDSSILEEIKSLKDDEIDNWINTRLDNLESGIKEKISEIRPSQLRKTSKIHGFISKETEIRASEEHISAVFQLDDKDVYKTLIYKLKEKNNLDTPYDIIQSIQNSINEYFGGLAYDENEENRYNLYVEMYKKYPDLDPHSISEYRNNDTALCTERGAIAQNMLAFLGADTYYLMGHLSNNKGIKNLNHAYNCILDKEYGSGIVFDFTNPVIRESSNEMYVSQSRVINKDEMSKFLDGNGKVEIERPIFYMKDGTEYREISYSMYSLNELSKEEINKLSARRSVIEETEHSIISTQDLGKETLDVQEDTEEKNRVLSDLSSQMTMEQEKGEQTD